MLCCGPWVINGDQRARLRRRPPGCQGTSGRACSTSTASSPTPRRSTPPRGSRCSTSSCATRERTASRSCRSTQATTTTSTSTASPARTARAPSSPRAASSCPRAADDDPPDARDRARPGQPQERPACSSSIERDGVEVFDGSVRYVRGGARRRPAHRGRLLERQHRGGARRRRARRTCSRPGSTASWPPSAACRASRRPTRSSPAAAALGRRARRRRPSSRTRWPGVDAGRAGGFGCRRRRPGRARPTRCARTAPTSSSPTWRSCWGPMGAARASDRDEPVVPAVEPWALRETGSTSTCWPRRESLFALSNGHIGLRGNLDEGEPHGLPGTYLNSVYELRPLPYAEAGYGYPESGQTVINVTNGKLIRLLVDDEPFDVRYGELLRARARARLARRHAEPATVEWTLAGRHSRSGSRSDAARLAHPALGRRRSRYEVEAARRAGRGSSLQSELVANEPLPRRERATRGSAAALERRSSREEHVRATGRRRAACTAPAAAACGSAAGHGPRVEAPTGRRPTSTSARPDVGRAHGHRRAGARASGCGWSKFVGYGWSSPRSGPRCATRSPPPSPAPRTPAGTAARRAARVPRRLLGGRRRRGRRRRRAPAGGPVRAVPRAAGRRAGRAAADPGEGPDRPRLRRPRASGTPRRSCCRCSPTPAPEAAADALRWRHRTLAAAQQRAAQLGLEGAAFPWRTINGEECSGYWPAGTAAFHVNADIADAVVRYVDATGDEDFERDVGVELLVETARLWRSLGHHDRDGRFRIDGVTGPDEYSAIADNNVYTNLMAQRNLRGGAPTPRAPSRAGARAAASTTEEIAAWRRRADAMRHPVRRGARRAPAVRGLHRPRGAGTSRRRRPRATRCCCTSRTSTSTASRSSSRPTSCSPCTCAATPSRPRRRPANFAYYEAPHRARLVAVGVHPGGDRRRGRPPRPRATTTPAEAALDGPARPEHNTRDGLHIASLAGAWTALVAGFGGMRDHAGTLIFAPRLPDGLDRLAFTIRHRGHRLSVDTDGRSATYTLADQGGDLQLSHHGELHLIRSGVPLTLPVPPGPPAPQIHHPAGRAPTPRVPRPTP